MRSISIPELLVVIILLTPLVATTIVLAVSFIAAGLRDLIDRIQRDRTEAPEPENEDAEPQLETD
jgi:hypothetical protein